MLIKILDMHPLMPLLHWGFLHKNTFKNIFFETVDTLVSNEKVFSNKMFV